MGVDFDAEVFSSYLDAYINASKEAAKNYGAPSRASTSRYPQKRQPSPYVEYKGVEALSKKTVSVLHRPKNPPASKKNVENLDTQFEKDKDAFERHANTFRRHAGERWHHNKPAGSILTLWEQGHIVDKGRGQAANQDVYDPILHKHRNPTTDENKRPQSAPHSRPTPASQSPSQQHKVMQEMMGRYNPITHDHIMGNGSQEYAAQKLKEFERATGGRGIAHRPDREAGHFNPISGEFKPHATKPSTAQSIPARPASAPRERPAPAAAAAAPAAPAVPAALHPAPWNSCTRPSTPSRCAPAEVPAQAAQAAPVSQRPATPSRATGVPAERPTTPNTKPRVLQGESWGTYDPIRHEWQVTPSNSKFQEQNKVLDRQAGISGMHHRKAAPHANQGIYNPILNSWVVPPENPRIVEGLSFQPATLFSRVTPATIRV